MPETETCTIPDLVADGISNGADAMDVVDSQAAIVYMLAVTIKALGPGAPDYTDICALAQSLSEYDGIPGPLRNAARLEAWSEITENTTAEELDWSAMRKAIACAHCCGVTKAGLENAMTFLLCRLSSLIQPV